MSIREGSLLTPEARAFLNEWRSDSVSVTAHTSGSTGAPKRIELLKSDMRASAEATVRFFGLSPDSTLFLPLSPDYIAGKMQIVRAEIAGSRLIVVPPSSKLFDYGGELPEHIEMLPIVPAQLRGLLLSPLSLLTDNVIIGGAPLSPAEEQLAAEAPFTSWATYGMTETCSHVALRRVGEECYTGLPGYVFSTDPRGCLVIDNPVMSFGRLVTNDLVELKTPGLFRWLGRFDNVINSGSVKIHPEQIESIISKLLPVGTTFYVDGRPSERWGTEVVIVTDSSEVNGDLLAKLKEHLPGAKVPKAIIHIPLIPRTASGKIIRCGTTLTGLNNIDSKCR